MLEYGPDFDCELLPAFLFIAFPQPDPGLALTFPVSALELGCPADRAAMGANRAIRPKGFLKEIKGRRFIMEMRF